MEKDIGKIMKNDTTDIVLRIDDFADKRGFTIREFVTSDRYTGFTKSGVRILAKDWSKFKEMVNSVVDEDMVEATPTEAPAEQATLDEAPADTPKEAPVKEEAPKEELPDY
jgi:hypothetical protein